MILKNNMKKIYTCAAISILLWSTIATISKLLLTTLNSYQVLCISALFAALANLAVIVFTKKLSLFKSYKPKDYVTMILIGLPGTFFYYVFLYSGTSRMLASQAFIINYLWPIMSIVFACIVIKDKLTLRKGIAVAVSFLGVITVAGGELINFNANSLLGAALCIGAAVSYGLFTALNQKWHYDKQVALFLSYTVAFLLTLVINVASGATFSVNALQLAGLAWNGIGVMAVATTTWAIALDSGKTAKISNLAYITPFLSLVWTSIFLKEPIELFSIVGLAIIILGIFIQLKEKPQK